MNEIFINGKTHNYNLRQEHINDPGNIRHVFNGTETGLQINVLAEFVKPILLEWDLLTKFMFPFFWFWFVQSWALSAMNILCMLLAITHFTVLYFIGYLFCHIHLLQL